MLLRSCFSAGFSPLSCRDVTFKVSLSLSVAAIVSVAVWRDVVVNRLGSCQTAVDRSVFSQSSSSSLYLQPAGDN